MSLFKISEKFVLNKLKLIKNGNLKLVNYDGKVYHFGDLENSFTAEIKVINPKFYLDIILGGKSRQESELKALKTLKEKNVQDEDLIVIHDSARAFLPAKLLLNLIEHAKQNQSAAPYIRTLLVSKDLSEYINENIVEIQTPQIFNFKTLSKAYIKTSDNNFDSVDTTERVSQETGLEASLIEGSNLNKKITFKEDLDKIQVLLEVEN